MTSGISIERDVSYLGARRREKLDVYLPRHTFARPLPAVLLIHGGGWRIGDKASAREQSTGNTLATHGYAVFSINYRLNKGRKDPVTGRLRLSRLAWPQNFYDCKSALRFMKARAGTYGLDPHRIAVMGSSAGGHLAMLVAATARREDVNRHGAHLRQSNEVSCALNFYGDYDIRGRTVSPLPEPPRRRPERTNIAPRP